MKCTVKIVVCTMIFVFTLFSVSLRAMNNHEGIPGRDIKNIHLRAGNGNLEKILSDEELKQLAFKNHKKAFGATLKKISIQADKFNDAKNYNLSQAKNLLPPDFHDPQILTLANAVDFSHVDDAESRAKKFVRLGLLIRDMYDQENNIAQNLGLLQIPLDMRLSQPEIMWLVTESFDQAAKELKRVEPDLTDEQFIDFNLSYAQILLWKLYYSHQSLLHSLIDFEMQSDVVAYGIKTRQTADDILLHLSMAELLVNDPEFKLPEIYHYDFYKLAKNLSVEQKYDLIAMHKDELDQLRMKESQDPLLDLNRASGFVDVDKNPLDYFTPQKIQEIENFAISIGITKDGWAKFTANTMRNYALKKVIEPENYFRQDVLQRFLLKSGSLTREMLAQNLNEKILNLRLKTLELSNIKSF